MFASHDLHKTLTEVQHQRLMATAQARRTARLARTDVVKRSPWWKRVAALGDRCPRLAAVAVGSLAGVVAAAPAVAEVGSASTGDTDHAVATSPIAVDWQAYGHGNVTVTPGSENYLEVDDFNGITRITVIQELPRA